MNRIATGAGYPGFGSVYVIVRREGMFKPVTVAQLPDQWCVEVPGAGDIIQQVLEQGFGHLLLQDIHMLVSQAANFRIQLT